MRVNERGRPTPTYVENAILAEAERVADRVVEQLRQGWGARGQRNLGLHTCAYHHASDLLHHRAGLRTTTRCARGYQPSDLEQRVEAVLGFDRASEGAA